MANKNAEQSKSRGASTFKIFLIVLVLLLIPTTMEQLSMHEDTVRLVGRVCVGIAVLFFGYGMISKVFRLGSLIILVLIIGRVLANEGVIHIPKIMPKIEEAREKGR